MGISTTSVTFLPANVTAAQWSPDGSKIAYIIPKNKEYHLTIADENGQKPEVLYSTPIPDFNIFWPSNNDILLVSRPSGVAPGILLGFDTKSKTVNEIITNAYGLTVLPSPDGKKIIFSKTIGFGGKSFLYISDTNSSLFTKTVGIATLPEKCVFSENSSNILCAIPRNMSAFQILPDDWYMGKGFFQDMFIKINATSSAINVVFNEKSFDAYPVF